MTKQELIRRLAAFPDHHQVMIDDGEGPRTLNVGPIPSAITHQDADRSYDCEERVGEPIILIGFGSY